MSLGNLAKYKSPVGGGEGSILSLGGWWQMILGAFVLFAALGVGSWLFTAVRRLLPGQVQGYIGEGGLPARVSNLPQAAPDAKTGVLRRILPS